MTTSCGADSPVREVLKSETKNAKPNAIRAATRRTFTIFAAALREIFEESAYERFLAREQVATSPVAYRDFLRETDDAKARRPKCC
jgi:hypothetical protein